MTFYSELWNATCCRPTYSHSASSNLFLSLSLFPVLVRIEADYVTMQMSSIAVNMNYQLVIGPLLVGVVTNAFVFGVCIMQLITYSTFKYKDSWWILGILAWIFAMDAFQVCISVSMLWRYVVANFGNPAMLASAPWEYASLPIFSSIAPVPIQQFMAYRIMCFSRSRFLFVFISALSLGQASLACASAAQGLTHTALQNRVTIMPIAAAWIVLGIMCDASISISLLFYLLKSRTGYERTDSIISKVCLTIVRAAVPVTVLCTIDLCLLTTMPNNNLHFMFALPVGRLYTCTFLSTLNGRMQLRKQLQNSASDQDVNLVSVTPRMSHSRGQAARVQIDIENSTAPVQSVNLEDVRDVLRSMKVDDDEVESIPELQYGQIALGNRL